MVGRRRGDVEKEIEGHRHYEEKMGENERGIICFGEEEEKP